MKRYTKENMAAIAMAIESLMEAKRRVNACHDTSLFNSAPSLGTQIDSWVSALDRERESIRSIRREVLDDS